MSRATLVFSLAATIAAAAGPCEGGIVVLKNGEVVVGRIDAADDAEERLVVHWPYGERTSRGILAIPKYRVRWFDRALDAPSGAYWEAYADAPIDERWLPALEVWRRSRGAPGCCG